MSFLKKRIQLNNKQREIIEWLIRHRKETAYSTWVSLFNERKSEYPDRCIAYYDGLSTKEKTDVELIIARYFSKYVNNRSLTVRQVFKDLSCKA